MVQACLICVFAAKSVKIPSSNTMSQDTAFNSGRQDDPWRVTVDTQLTPPGEHTRSQHGTLSTDYSSYSRCLHLFCCIKLHIFIFRLKIISVVLPVAAGEKVGRRTK